ncbi:MAG: N,N'-diacetylchitobiose phosphorylase [Oscillospiraceae bacterium]|nr:N,N'-diacetylchitobiose phosphorylase [Oscillospiraceae bacterium]MBR0391343.1 N,N'-diacetylchitobiose phosphorylase [Oscillospiraceae bacterium]
MQYGYFDNERREYVIERVDLPVSWTNYIGIHDMYGVFNHTAGGYLLYKSPEYHRITRFRPNGVPMDGPGHYVYLRDDENGDYWTISWQPTGKPKEHYSCRHGLSYIRYHSDYSDIDATQTLFVAMDDPVEIWDVRLRNDSGRPRKLAVFSYLEFSFHQIDMDNRNFQMSLYAAGSRFKDGVIEHDLYYEENGYQFFTSSFEPDGFDCLRDTFLGPYRTERNPIAVENGCCRGSFEKGGNHCGCLQKKLVLQPGEEVRLLFLLGEGGLAEGKRIREKYSFKKADEDFRRLGEFWEEKLSCLQVQTPNAGMNTELNIWNLYQSEINVMFSRFTSFIEVGGRTGLGYRDTAQDAMMVPHADPDTCRKRLIELLRALTKEGYGLHLFEPRWFEEHQEEQSFRSPTVIPQPDRKQFVHGIQDACADDALWLVSAVVQYIKETGDLSFARQTVTYADGGEGTVYEHLTRILNFSAREVGQNGICKGLRADWNDCLNLGGGESAMVSFLHIWAMHRFCELANALGRKEDAQHYAKLAGRLKKECAQILWDGEWFIRGITADNRRIGTQRDTEGKVHMESNTWAVISGAASLEQGLAAMDSIDRYLYTEFGLMLNAPCYTKPDDAIGFVTRVYPGLKENGAVFSHPNPWAWCAEAILGRGERAMKYYNALCPALQNDRIEIRQSEPYSYCQFVVGKDHPAFGRARHPFMTGSSGWAYYAATQYILGIRPEFDGLTVDPCIPAEWGEFSVTRKWRGSIYYIHVTNPNRVQKGVCRIVADGKEVRILPMLPADSVCHAEVTMG